LNGILNKHEIEVKICILIQSNEKDAFHIGHKNRIYPRQELINYKKHTGVLTLELLHSSDSSVKNFKNLTKNSLLRCSVFLDKMLKMLKQKHISVTFHAGNPSLL